MKFKLVVRLLINQACRRPSLVVDICKIGSLGKTMRAVLIGEWREMVEEPSSKPVDGKEKGSVDTNDHDYHTLYRFTDEGSNGNDGKVGFQLCQSSTKPKPGCSTVTVPCPSKMEMASLAKISVFDEPTGRKRPLFGTIGAGRPLQLAIPESQPAKKPVAPVGIPALQLLGSTPICRIIGAPGNASSSSSTLPHLKTWQLSETRRLLVLRHQAKTATSAVSCRPAIAVDAKPKQPYRFIMQRPMLKLKPEAYTIDGRLEHFRRQKKTNPVPICVNCRKLFTTFSRLQLHQKANCAWRNLQKRRFVCKFCGELFTQRWAWQQHLVLGTTTCKISREVADLVDDLLIRVEKKLTGPFVCRICGNGFQTVEEWRAHAEERNLSQDQCHANRLRPLFECVHCNGTFHHRYQLFAHDSYFGIQQCRPNDDQFNRFKVRRSIRGTIGPLESTSRMSRRQSAELNTINDDVFEALPERVDDQAHHPKKPRSAFLFWRIECNISVGGTDGIYTKRDVGKRWRTLVDKSKWQQMADADQARYKAEMMQRFGIPEASPAVIRKPKSALSYFLHDEVYKQYPMVPHNVLAKRARNMWLKLADKTKWYKLEEDDRKRYRRECGKSGSEDEDDGDQVEEEEATSSTAQNNGELDEQGGNEETITIDQTDDDDVEVDDQVITQNFTSRYPKSAFFHWLHANWRRYHPQKKMPREWRLRKAGQAWRELKDKSKWLKMAEADKKRFRTVPKPRKMPVTDASAIPKADEDGEKKT